MRILFVYTEDARAINVQSGRPYSIYRTFQQRGHEIVDLFPLRRKKGAHYAFDKFKAWLAGRTYGGERHISYLYAMKLLIEEAISVHDPDLIFSPSSIPLSLVSGGRCRIFCADATFYGLASTYPRLARVSSQYSKEAHFQEWIAMRTADFCVYPSQWAAFSAKDEYEANEDKVCVIPFGANIASPPSSDLISMAVMKRALDSLQFVFIGLDWIRKGGDRAVELIEALNSAGIAAHLHVIGTNKECNKNVTFHGFLDKSDKVSNGKFSAIMERCHFFILPTSAEAYGLSFCEALCYGLPCIGHKVGGVADIITEDHNGFYLDGLTKARFVDKIRTIIESPEIYRRLCTNARQDYDARFTWNAFVSAIETLTYRHSNRSTRGES